MNAFILAGGRVIDPVNQIDRIQDIGIADGIFVDPATLAGAERVSVAGLAVAPGFIDIHVHLREPGQTHKEDLRTGTEAAAAGGFTTVVAMPNTSPAVDSPEIFAQVQALIREKAVVRVIQSATLSKGRQGRELSDMLALKAAGCQMLSDDGTCIQNHRLMLEALRLARQAGLPVSDHCEEDALADGGVMNEGDLARELGLPGKNRTAEELIVARNILLGREAGWPVHIQHVSSANSVAMIRWAQSQGIAVTAEATPHHICLTEACVRSHGPDAKMNPPLCTETDRQAIIDGLADGTIACIATDHAPHAPSEKAQGMLKAPAGIVGLEAAVPLCLTELYHSKRLSLAEFIAKFTAGPRQVMPGLPYGTLSSGAPADVTLLDLETIHILHAANFRSRSKNCPYEGMKCQGRVAGTIVGGRWVFRAF
jgi:dihydroorotase